MLIRALMVLLVVLNLGTAVWWAVQPESPPYRPVSPEPGIASLELVAESELPTPAPVDAAADAPDMAASPSSGTPEPAMARVPEPESEPVRPARCYRLGPFTTRDQAASAQSALGERLSRARIAEVTPPSRTAERFRILYPPLPSRAEAQEVVKRINAAGFRDYFLIENGEYAHGIALGIYRSREGAERQLAALNAAGFPAEIIQEKAGSAPSQWWLSVETAEITANALRRQTRVAQAQTLDCAALR